MADEKTKTDELLQRLKMHVQAADATMTMLDSAITEAAGRTLLQSCRGYAEGATHARILATHLERLAEISLNVSYACASAEVESREPKKPEEPR